MVFLKALFLVHFSSLSILLLLVLLYLNLLSIIISMLMTLNSIYHSHLLNLRLTCFYFMMLSLKSQIGCLLIYYLLTSLKLNFFLSVFLSNCLSYLILSLLCLQTSLSHLLLLLAILGSSLTPLCLCLTTYLPSVNLVSVIFVILGVFVALLILLYTAKTIATSRIHSRLDYCNSLFLNLPSTELHRLQLVLHATARAITKTPKFLHITPILKSLHWLKINQRIHYKIVSLIYTTLQSNQPSYLYSLLAVQTNNITRSSSVVTLCRPTVTSRLQITNRSFFRHAPDLWNNLPVEMRPTSSSTHSNTMHTSCRVLLFLHLSFTLVLKPSSSIIHIPPTRTKLSYGIHVELTCLGTP